MKITKILFYVFALSLLVTSCGKSTELSDAIPADAMSVFHLNNQSLIEKSKYDIFQNPTIQQGINVYKAFLKDQDAVKMLEEFMKDPNSLGLDLKKDIYFYTGSKTYGMVIGVNDADKLKDALLKLFSVQEENIQKNGDIYTLSLESMLTIAWDGSKLLLLADITSAYGKSGGEPVNVQELAVEQLKQGADKSINSVKSFAEFLKQRKDISIFYNMDALESTLKMGGSPLFPAELMKLYQQMFAEFKGISFGMYTSFEQGEIKATGQYYYDTPDTEKRLKELTAGMTGELKGEYLKYVKEDPLFMMAMNMKGEGVYQYLTRVGVVDIIEKEFPENYMSFSKDQLKELIKNVDGDITFVLSSIEKTVVDEELPMSMTTPRIMLFADVAKPDYVASFIKEQLDTNKVQYQELSPSVFMVNEGRINLYMGINNNTFFVTNIESVYNDLNASGLNNKYAEQIKGKSSLIAGNLQSLKPYLEENRDLKSVVALFNELGDYQMTTSVSDLSTDCKLEITTKDENSLAVFCKQIDALISSANMPLGGF